MEVDYLYLVGEGYTGSMQWQLGREMGTIPAFSSRTQENQETLCRDGKTCRNGNKIRKPTASFHFTPSPIHYSLIILPLDAM